MSSHPPHLLLSLRRALAVLYNLPSPDGGHLGLNLSSQDAHEFLMQFQSRNVRRKLQSQAKSHRHKQQQQGGDPQAAFVPTLEAEDYGSTWMSCIALLASISHQSQHNVNFAEALFAAQTLVHRLRRVKTVESIDFEFEPPVTSQPPQPQELLQVYLAWMKQLDPTISQVLLQYSPHSGDEECIKGELTMMTLSTILYRLTLEHCHDISRIRPLLTTLASAFAVTAARLRFSPVSVPNPSPNTQPIVTMMLQALKVVHQFVASTATSPPEQQMASYVHCLYTCFSAIPDAILAGGSSGGGAYGRMSMDPRCYTAVTTEVRTQGITQVWESFADLPTPEGDHLVRFLHMCEEWAKYAPMPMEFVQRSMSLVEVAFSDMASKNPTEDQLAAGRAAMCYWTAIMESGSWTVEQVLSASLIQKNETSQQPNKKRQSGKSKRRQKEVLEERTTANQLVLAQNEVHHRGEIALHTAKRTWKSFWVLLEKELASVVDVDDEVMGDGPVGGITACANACLPYMLQQHSLPLDSVELFASIGLGIREVCSSPSRMVRSFAAETLYTLHETLLGLLAKQDVFLTVGLEPVVVDHFFQCSMNLAARCCYPPGYFHNLGANNDEELENERNDVRDVLRAVASSSSGTGKPASAATLKLSSTVLMHLLRACAEPIQLETNDPKALFPESAIHAYSALARPLISIASIYCQSPSEAHGEILGLSLNVILSAGQRLNRAFETCSLSEILPLSRLFNLALASLAPMLSILSSVPSFEHLVSNVLAVGLRAATASLMNIPELAAPSTLRSTRYDIRGAMRTPGGEDHAGCLALMRLGTESPELSLVFIKTDNAVVSGLCEVYKQLKMLEGERGRSVLHGKGVLPKSRRILLEVICHLEIVSNGTAGVGSVLKDMFDASVHWIAGLASCGEISIDTIFHTCEHVFDLAAFSPVMVRTLFEAHPGGSSSPQGVCLNILRELGNFGFQALEESAVTQEKIHQWVRLRASLFCLFKASGTPDLPPTAVDMLISWIRAECDAINLQCFRGPESPSSVFHEDLISDEVVPAGVFIQVLGELLDQGSAANFGMDSMVNCIKVLHETSSPVLQAFTSACPNPVRKGSFRDPRPTLAEAWFLVVNRLIRGLPAQGMLHPGFNQPEAFNALQGLALHSCVSSIVLLLQPTLGQTQEQRLNDSGMSPDGPHTLVMMNFLELFFSLGPSMLQAVALELLLKIPIDRESLKVFSDDPHAAGIAIIGAALFRAAQGGLPPWGVECIPAVYSSLYKALERKSEVFRLVLQMSMNVRLAGEHSFGGVRAGRLLSGRYFESMGEKAKSAFVDQAVDLARTDTPATWKRLKALVKQACGGKKKDTDFKQKPGLTKWDALDRI